jgi:hypothetical protein
MAKKRKVSSRRVFRGDNFTLKTPKKGLSLSEAKKRAKKWRAKGYAAVVDHGVGGSKKYGVYVRKRKKRKKK